MIQNLSHPDMDIDFLQITIFLMHFCLHFAAAMWCSSLHKENLTDQLQDSPVKRSAQPHYFAHAYDRGYRSGFKQGFHYSY